MRSLGFAIVLAAFGLSATAPPRAQAQTRVTPQQQARLNEAANLYARSLELRKNGQTREALPVAQQSLAIRRELLGENHALTAESLNFVGLLLKLQGNLAAARTHYEQALEIRKRVLGLQHADTATTLSNLGTLLNNQGDFAVARVYLEQSLAIRRQVLGPRHAETATSLNNLAMLFEAQGEYASARQYLEQSFAIRKEVLGLKHTDTASSLNNLANASEYLGEYAASRAYHEQALAIYREVAGPKHPDTARSMNNLGHLLVTMGDYPAARMYHEQALAIRREVLGPNHPDMAVSLNSVGFVLSAQGDYAGARPYYEQALAINQEVYGPKHSHTGRSLNNLARLLEAQGDLAAARTYYEQGLAINKDALGPKHPITVISLNNLGVLANSMGDVPAARSYQEQALDIRKAVLGPKHADTATSQSNLAVVLQAQGDFAAARPLLEEALATRREVLGAKHPDTASALANLAHLRAAEGEWGSAADGLDQSRRAVRQHVARVLPSLSAKEQATYLSKKDKSAFHFALSVGWSRRDDARFVEDSAAWLANGKAVAQEALAQKALLTREVQDPALAGAVKQLIETRRQLSVLAMSNPKAGQESARHDKLAQLEREEERLSWQIAQTHGEKFQADPWIDVAAIRAVIPAGEVLVDIVRLHVFDFAVQGDESPWQRPRYAAWIFPPAGAGEIRIVDLGDAQTIERATLAVRKALTAASREIVDAGEPEAEASLKKPLSELAGLVLQPLREHLGDARRLIISPDAALWLVPWGALPLTDGRYAIEQYGIRYVVSGRDVVAKASANAPTAQPVIMANPNYDLGPAETLAATRAVLRSAMPPQTAAASLESVSTSSRLAKVSRLPGTDAEAKAITPGLQTYAGIAPLVYTDQWALEGVFKAIKRPKVLMLSTHGFFLPARTTQHDSAVPSSETRGTAPATSDQENPLLRCGLLLTGCNTGDQASQGRSEDGVVTGMEIVGMDLRGTELVVLSACETGVGQLQIGEGVAGLRQAFQLAGAQSVVATLWQIPDQESAQLMTGFFTNLAEKQTKADALRNAQLALIKSHREQHKAAHPFFWAAYTLTGE